MSEPERREAEIPIRSRRDELTPEEGRVLSVHLGHAANCSSIGSFIDFLFVSSVAGAAVLAAVTALMRTEAEKSAGREPTEASPEASDAIEAPDE